MSQDEQRRAEHGVVACMVPTPDGGYRLVLDDVSSSSADYPQVWNVTRLFTYKDFDGTRLIDTNLSEEELADIGLSLVARLVAFEEVKRGKKK